MKKNILSFYKKRRTLFIISLLVFSLFLIVKYVWSTYSKETYYQEGLTEPPVIILLGDSVLKNDHYVAADKTVEAFIKKSTASNTASNTASSVVNFAEDENYIEGVDLTLLEEKKYNNEHTYIFLSIGGNDLIRMRDTEKVMVSYSKLIERLKKKMPLAKLVLLNIYYPPAAKESTNVKNMIAQWNLLLAKQEDKANILDISKLLTDASDFVSNIEPSETGGKKLAEAILKKVNDMA
jgi:lysophospholipase L1-like esterase